MSRSPEDFRGLSPAGIMAVLMVDEANDRHTKARAVGASCAACRDTGMNGGLICGCEAGNKLALQGFGQ